MSARPRARRWRRVSFSLVPASTALLLLFESSVAVDGLSRTSPFGRSVGTLVSTQLLPDTVPGQT